MVSTFFRAKLRRLVVALAVFLAFSPGIATADMAVGTGAATFISANIQLLTTGTVTLKAGAGQFVGVANAGGIAQITALTCYDNPSAASGPVVYNGTLGLFGTTFPVAGQPFALGLTCVVGGTLLGNGVAVYWR